MCCLDCCFQHVNDLSRISTSWEVLGLKLFLVMSLLIFGKVILGWVHPVSWEQFLFCKGICLRLAFFIAQMLSRLSKENHLDLPVWGKAYDQFNFLFYLEVQKWKSLALQMASTTRLKPRGRSFIQTFPVVDRIPKTWAAFAAFPLTQRWTESWAARTRTSVHLGCCHFRQWFYLLCYLLAQVNV